MVVISQTRMGEENRSCDYFLKFCKVLLLVIYRYIITPNCYFIIITIIIIVYEYMWICLDLFDLNI